MKGIGNEIFPSDILDTKKVREMDSIEVSKAPRNTKEADSCSIEMQNNPVSSSTTSGDSSTTPSTEEIGVHALNYRVIEIPPWKLSLFFAFQQTMICMSGILTLPYLVSEIACAGSATIALRIKLISSTFVVTGFTTLLQTVIGLRLPILQGPSFAFLPPLYSYANLPGIKCNYSSSDDVPEEYYYNRIQTIQGSLACSSLLLIFIGATGAIGVVSKLIGPVTIFP
ncbi:hypothetical protein FO519_004654, partial [Halicephalobus sp. NKZ332]